MDPNELIKFIAKAHRNTYAAPAEVKKKYKCEVPILPEHKDYDFTEGDWRYHDSYAGQNWAPGREVVFFQGKAVWCMAYQGKVIDELTEQEVEEVYGVLKKAMMNFSDDEPFRGPANFKEGDYEYSFTFKGDYKYFVGRENITYKGKELFFQDVMGALIK